ncbi:MAG: cardiolipin synthase, partial [Opitutales bacterium]
MPSGLIIGLALAWVLGLLTSLVVLREPRSSEGTIAWVFGLLVMPVLVVPLYWGLGSIHDLRAVEGRTRKVKQRRAAVGARGGGEPAKGDLGALLRLTPHPLQGGNAAELLCDGDAVFAAMEAAIEGARESVLVQFYTIAVDATAERFIEALRRAHRRGVRVCLLYDPLGSHRFERRWVKGLRREGLEVKPFSFG